MDINLLFSVLFVGIGATLVMDAWALCLKKAFSIPSLNYCLVGRWLQHMPSGRITHQNIAQAESKSLECHVGWVFHYVIGIVFSAILIAAVTPAWLSSPTILPALIFGVITVSVPFLLMQPSFGLGIAASKTPNPTQARIRSLMAHVSFGVGLYLAAVTASFISPIYA